MNRETRVEKISAILEQDPYAQKEIMWQDKLEVMPVYKISLKYLLYNKYNGRILSRTQSLEAQGKNLNPENENDRKILEKLLWDSKPDRNKKTLLDLETHGQKEIGIITKDGIIIDGNRRAMLLNRIDKYDYFKAVILPVTLEQNPIEIEKLETSYQMGADEKLGYNPIEKYIKAKNLAKKGISTKEISDWMGENESTIKDYLAIMETMDDYLDYLQYNGIYTQLDGREDQFINLTKWLNTFYNGSTKGFTGYLEDDVDDLKAIGYDYIRIKYEGKKFRQLAYGLQDKHIFGNKEIWQSFSDKHFEFISPIIDEEGKPNLDTNNIEATLNARDEDFKVKTENFLDDNLDEHYTQIRYKQAQDEPKKLVKNATRAIQSINKKNLSKPEVIEELSDLRDEINNIIQDKSPEKALEHIIRQLSNIAITDIQDNELADKYLKQINKLSFDLSKSL
jgi:hypothetical protein